VRNSKVAAAVVGRAVENQQDVLPGEPESTPQCRQHGVLGTALLHVELLQSRSILAGGRGLFLLQTRWPVALAQRRLCAERLVTGAPRKTQGFLSITS